MHLIIDGYGAPAELLRDVDFIYRFLDDYPSSLAMTKMTQPQVYTYVGATPQDWGLSGFVLIAESHISIHTFPDRNYLNIDVFSCKEFDTDNALAFLRQHFALGQLRSWVLERGLEHLDPPQEVEVEVLTAERGQLSQTWRG